jgi:hypothetical protein
MLYLLTAEIPFFSPGDSLPLAPPRLLAWGHHLALPMYPSCMHLPGAGVPTQGTSYWGHPLGESNDKRIKVLMRNKGSWEGILGVDLEVLGVDLGSGS